MNDQQGLPEPRALVLAATGPTRDCVVDQIDTRGPLWLPARTSDSAEMLQSQPQDALPGERGAVLAPASSSSDTAGFLLALGKRVRLLRLTGELTQDELAVKAGMSRSFVSLIEHGRHGIDVARLARLAAAFGMPLSTLIREAELRTEPKEHR
jgi:hypothetical protein